MKVADKIDLALVEKYAQVCDSQEDIARALGLDRSTIKKAIKENEDFAEAVARGKSKANIFVGGKLIELIKSGNPAATIFYLKSRCGWKEARDNAFSVKGEVTSKTPAVVLSPDVIAQVLNSEISAREEQDDSNADKDATS